MVFIRILTAFLSILISHWGQCSEISNLRFPSSFLFGAATSSYQIEGAWNVSGKGIGYLDDFFQNTNTVADGSNGNIACDSYHKYQEDIQLLKDLKVHYYRFSISWPRLLPTGFVNRINPDGVDYYNRLIDGLLEAGIEPWVTIYHFDGANSIANLGDWNNPKIADYFVAFADLVFSLYGDRVKTWFTINEPLSFCISVPNGLAAVDPAIPLGITEYMCSHNVLRAHGKTYRLYREKYWAQQQGRLALVLSTEFPVPDGDAEVDIEAAERKRQFDLGMYAHPLVHGNYPQVVIDAVRNYSIIQGFSESRLPTFTPEEIEEIKGSYDFYATNHYSSVLIKDNRTVSRSPSFQNDGGVNKYPDPSWPGSMIDWLNVYPEGFRQYLNWIKDTYQNPEIVVSEQGYVDDGRLDDTGRVNYYRLYLDAALRAIHEDGVRLTAYTAWSLIDNFEWFYGYLAKFGLYHVDFNSDNRTRTAKQSVSYYRKVIETRCLVDVCQG